MKNRQQMISYLLLFCTTIDEHEAEAARLDGLTAEALEAEFTEQYNALEGSCPSRPLYEESIDPITDLYL